MQDPALGWLAQRLRAWRWLAVLVGVAVLAGSMLGLFAVAPPIAPLWWFALMMTGLFSAFSFLTICMYAQGVAAAPRLGPQGYLGLAAWRETGRCWASASPPVAPTALDATGDPYGNFALGFAALCLVALWLMRAEWTGAGSAMGDTGFRAVLSDAIARRLLIVALMNAAPVAVSSTLFLSYVE